MACRYSFREIVKPVIRYDPVTGRDAPLPRKHVVDVEEELSDPLPIFVPWTSPITWIYDTDDNCHEFAFYGKENQVELAVEICPNGFPPPTKDGRYYNVKKDPETFFEHKPSFWNREGQKSECACGCRRLFIDHAPLEVGDVKTRPGSLAGLVEIEAEDVDSEEEQ